jgi:DNA-binding transcriptional ArsR family regulator
MHPTIPGARFGIASFGELVSDPSRVAILLSLMDGLARPASELARIAGVTPSTASAHLHRLTLGGLLRSEPSGRHRYFRLANDGVAEALEVIALQVHSRPCVPSDSRRLALSKARTCYKHLAGRLGVAWFAALQSRNLVRSRDGSFVLAKRGVRYFHELALEVPAGTEGKSCLDWTERRPHLGGPLGTLITQHLLSISWVARLRESRALRVTAAGVAGFSSLGLSIDA